jgi:flagellar hook-associated protein 1 FlgK
MSDFSGLNLALSALQAQRRGLELAAHNVANANTEGYSRQRLDLVNVGAPAVPALWSRYTGDGGGVRVADVVRFRDQFMEAQAALEHGAAASLAVGARTMQSIEQLFDEPSGSGLAKQLSDFWAGFDDVANHPADLASRTQLLERATTLVSSLNSTSATLSRQRTNAISELGATVTEINTLADEVARLNKAIKAATVSGLSVNDLLDQRDLLATRLAELTGATLRHTEFNQVVVVLGGTPLVQQETAARLLLDTSGTPVVLRWEAMNTPAVVTSGKAGGLLNTVNTTIPAYTAQLDAVALTLRDEVNALHGAIGGAVGTGAQDQSGSGNLEFEVALNGGGFATVTVAGADWSGAGGAAALEAALQGALDAALGAGNATATVTGGAGAPLDVSVTPTGTNTLQARAAASNTGFATLLGATAVGLDGVGGRRFFEGTDARALALSADVAGNPEAVAAAVASNGPLDGTRALDIADLAQSLTGPDATYRQMIVQLGVDTQTAVRRDEIQAKAAASLDNSRQAYSGVNTDEEMMHLVEYQRAYEAAARFLTAIDSILDTLINRTGATR